MRVDWQRIVFASTRFADDGGPSDADREALEARVRADATDADARVRLVGFYYGHMEPAQQQRRAEHLAWLAEHRPDIGLGGSTTIFVSCCSRPVMQS